MFQLVEVCAVYISKEAVYFLYAIYKRDHDWS